MTLEPHQQRVVSELEELTKKTRALQDFLATPKAWDLSAIEIHLLNEQADCMNKYCRLLRLRVSIFGMVRP